MQEPVACAGAAMAAQALNIGSFLAKLESDYESFIAECDDNRAQHGAWLTETLEANQKQLLHKT